MKRRENSHSLIIIFINILLYQTNLAVGQSQSSPIQFHGSNKLFGQYSDMQGIGQEIPPSFLRDDLQMTLTVYGIPISSSFFITTEQRDFRQSIDNFRIYLDIAALKRATSLFPSRDNNAGSGKDSLKGKGALKMGRFLSIFTALEIGKCRPNYTELTLQGIAISGVNIEMNPGLFYAAFSMGKVKRSVEPSGSSKPTYKQDVLFARIGAGKKNLSHLYLTYMRVLDDENSLPSDLNSDSLLIYPQANHVIGTEGKLSLFKNKFTVEGEAAISLFTRDTKSTELELTDSQIPSWLNNYFEPNTTSSIDFSYNVKMGLKLRTTTLSGGIKIIGAGYKTLGNPNLISDRLTYDGRIDQTFAKNRINISAFYKYGKDNLVNWKTATTTTVYYGITGAVRFRKAPYFMVSYRPNFQKTNNDSLGLNNTIYVVTATTGYYYRIGKVQSNTNFNYCRQYSKIERNAVTDLSKTNSYTLNEELTFTIPLSVGIGANYCQSTFSNKESDILSLTLSGTYSTFEDRWQNSLSVTYQNESHEQNKLGFSLNSKVQLWKNGDLEIQLEKNNFTDNVQCTQNYNEFIAKLSFEVRW